MDLESEHDPLLPTVPERGAHETPFVAAASVIDGVNLRPVADRLPFTVWLATAVEMCDKFAFFGLSGPLQNYLQNSRDDPLQPGVIGLGQAGATAVNQIYMLWCFLTPLLGSVVADQYWGRVRTITYASLAYVCGLIMVVISSQLEPTAALATLAIAMFCIGIGTGGIRPNVNALLAEQYKPPPNPIRRLASGELVRVDATLTIQRIFMLFLLLVNLGSMSAVITTIIEGKYGFFATFMLPTVAFVLGFAVFLATRHVYVSKQPEGSPISHALRAFWITLRYGEHSDAIKSLHRDQASLSEHAPPSDSFMDELRTTLRACKPFIFFPFFWASYSQMLTNFISQAATMETSGIPNDLLFNLDPLTIVIFIPILEYAVFPSLRSHGIVIRPSSRIVCGFALCSIGMAYAALVQTMIYSSPPCYNFPRARDCMGGEQPNQVHVLVQTPAYILIALAEILVASAGLEMAHTRAPASMKSFVMSIFVSSYAAGAALALTITPFTVDPYLDYVYLGLSIETAVVGFTFWAIYGRIRFSAN